jgi:peptidoglycan/xylan/chitin deacetylase (PgdA/CDA1 family)
MKAYQTCFALLLCTAAAGCGQSSKSAVSSHTSNSQQVPVINLAAITQEAQPSPEATPVVIPPTLTPTASPAPTPIPSVPAKYVHYRDKVIVLMYHHIAESEANEDVTITPAKFESHLKVLKDQKYQIISIEDYVHYIKDNKAIPPNAVVITFDDGYESYYRYAFPLLKKYGYTATNFIVTSYIDSNNPSLPFMKWSEVKEMKDAGYSFYSHSHNLHEKVKGADNQLVSPLANRIWLDGKKRMETEDEYRKRIRDDLSMANQMLYEKLGNEMNILCFPYGFYNKTVIEVANEIGIDFFFTTRDGINTHKDKEIVRIQAGTRFMTSERFLAKLAKFQDSTSHPTK